MYKQQKLNVCWNGTYSDEFTCSNGVKQGGILSPIMFCVYIDELLKRLESSRVGCYIGDRFVGSFGYADDLSLLAPSVSAAKIMLSICEEYAIEYDVSFNASKSIHVVFRPDIVHNCNGVDLTLMGSPIKKVDSAVLLGMHIGKDGITRNLRKATGDLIYRTNILMSRFGTCSSLVLSRLFDSYCTSYYGSPLWGLSDAYLKDFRVAWRKCVRRIWKLNERTHCKYLPYIYAKPEIMVQLYMRFSSFFTTCVLSDNPVVALCSKVALTSKSVVADNVRVLLSYVNNNYVLTVINC